MTANLEPASLRDRQRSSRRLRIIETARRLFNRLGYESTTLDEIAAQSELSTVTVLHYFGSKGGLLVAIQTQFDKELYERLDPIIASPPQDPILATYVFFDTVFDHALRTMDRRVWKHVWANLFLEASTETGRGLATNERDLMQKLVLMLERLAADGCFKDGVDIPTLGEIIHHIQAVRSMEFMSDPSISRATLDATLRRDYAFIMGPHLSSQSVAEERPKRRKTARHD